MPPKDASTDNKGVRSATAWTEQATAQVQAEQAAATQLVAPTTQEFATAANWGDGGRFVINDKGERVSAEPTPQTKE